MLGAALLLGGAPLLARAEIYRWTDSSGATHFTQDLADVPVRYRTAALADAQSRAKIQTYSSPDAGRAGGPPAAYANISRSRSGQSFRVPFQRHGTLMKVNVRINGSVTAPFLVDTGASSISIPYALASRLGIRITSETPRRTAMTANGTVTQPVVRLGTVELHGAVVENLEASVSGSMDIGLLGGNFFNNFIYQVDSAAGVIVLTPNEGVASGLTEPQWRARFQRIREPLGRLEAALEAGGFLDESRLRELEERRTALRNELAELETEATRSKVPQRWRR